LVGASRIASIHNSEAWQHIPSKNLRVAILAKMSAEDSPPQLPPSEDERGLVTQLLVAADSGDPHALDDLFPVVYEDLRRLAQSYLGRERAGHTLQPTALVHEAFVRLVGLEASALQGSRHFFAVAARAMRRILVDHARRRSANKRGGEHAKLSLDRLPREPEARDACLLELDDALERLTEMDARKARVVELRFFGGLDIEATAAALDISHATVERDWAFARAWLARALETGE
jgi:RNA polymerase sigma factor (TIGR02999 family)